MLRAVSLSLSLSATTADTCIHAWYTQKSSMLLGRVLVLLAICANLSLLCDELRDLANSNGLTLVS